jgi:hypothetical protein
LYASRGTADYYSEHQIKEETVDWRYEESGMTTNSNNNNNGGKYSSSPMIDSSSSAQSQSIVDCLKINALSPTI